jgi:hypothetical protein
MYGVSQHNTFSYFPEEVIVSKVKNGLNVLFRNKNVNKHIRSCRGTQIKCHIINPGELGDGSGFKNRGGRVT